MKNKLSNIFASAGVMPVLLTACGNDVADYINTDALKETFPDWVNWQVQ